MQMWKSLGQRMVALFVVFALIAAVNPMSLLPESTADAAVNGYVKRNIDKLYEDSNGNNIQDAAEPDFRYISVNIPDALLINIYSPMGNDSERFRIPSDDELLDAVRTVKAMGGRVFRVFAMSSSPTYNAVRMITTNSASPSAAVTLNEDAMKAFDRLLQYCNQEGVRVSIGFTDNWAYVGGYSDYGSNFFTPGNATNVKFKNMISQILNRTNSYTGEQYKNDKAIFAWESGNELSASNDGVLDTWVSDLANYVKGIDANHLFIDGRNSPATFYNRYTVMNNANIDVLSYHTYINLSGMNAVQSLTAMRNYTKDQKVLNVGEIAMTMPTSTLLSFLDEMISGGTSSASWWALRFHAREGGFYHHASYEDLHWPGFTNTSGISEIATEKDILTALADHAYEIQGLTRPAIAVPLAPVLLPIPDTGHISWKGSTNASAYDVERATSSSGPWTVIAADFMDNVIVNRSLLSDTTTSPDVSYYYRVKAKNTSGTSGYSNVVGPVVASSRWLVDNLFDTSKMSALTSNMVIGKSYSNKEVGNDLAVLYRNDANPGEIVYTTQEAISSFRIETYSYNTTDLSVLTSPDGATYTSFTPATTSYSGSYNKPKVVYTSSALPTGTKYLKIAEQGTGQPYKKISRIEIESGLTTVLPPTSTNIAPTATLTVDSSNVSYAKTKAVDGIKNDNNSRWISANTAGTHVFQMDWPTAKTINNVKLWSGSVTVGGTQIRDFTIQYWNGSAWQVLATVVDNAIDVYNAQYNDFSFTPITTTKLKVDITDGCDYLTYEDARINEIEVYGY
ncbi:hypothetical protein [Paenibacillus qinlingensis]|uniref:mannan endo-1,4-beta-mannosidase n=1 Tax=Paenibacillus qinlingensis TaxID=1837343 RepID=A0ABU1P628_9BACL|nr:hypothetical protein [Paenibacillus qinlingensis]MDR6555213.1 hypothetical protein [Paenibacillus qinlingensis]